MSLSTSFDHPPRISPTSTSDAGAAGAAFLELLDPDGIHNLVAICPDTKALEARTFPPHSHDAIQRWVNQYEGRRNIYYSPNELMPGTGNVKPSKNDFAAVRAIYVDLDPDKTKDFADERKRLAAEIGRLESDPLHAPTFTVDTGGGFQAVWLLDEKLPAPEFRDAAEAQGRGLALALGGDHVQDISRLLRLPGTTNLPDAGKRSVGRTKASARLRAATGERFPLSWLADIAPPVAAPPGTDKNAGEEIAAAIAEIEAADLDGLAAESDLPARLVAAKEADASICGLWSGDTPPADASGSGYLFALAAKLHAIGGFSPVDLAQLAACWPVTSGKNYDARAIARAWVRSKPAPHPAAEDEFEPIGAASSEATTSDRSAGEGTTTPEPLPVENITDCRWQSIQDYLVKGLIIRGQLAWLTGDSNAGKSPLILEMAAHIAKGEAWRGRRVRRHHCLYLATEGAAGMSNRMEALKRVHGVTEAIPLDLRVGPLSLVASRKDTQRIIATCNERARSFGVDPGLVVIDTMSHTLDGRDDSDQEAVRKFLAHCKEIVAATGAALVVVSHPPKGSGSIVRGTGLQINDVDLNMFVEYDKATKVRTFRTPRTKDYGEIQPIKFTCGEFVLGCDQDGDAVTAPTIEWLDDAQTEFKIELSPEEAEALAAFEQARLDAKRDYKREWVRHSEALAIFAKGRSAPDKNAACVKNPFNTAREGLVEKGRIRKLQRGQYLINDLVSGLEVVL